jgi:peroxiredoxin/nitrate/TMAO reductase-like tetraheme cytochrome c subunit
MLRRVPVPVRFLASALLVTAVSAVSGLMACGSQDPTGTSKDASAEQTQLASSDPAKSGGEEKPARTERPLPAFSGWTLDDQRLDISSLIGKRLVVLFFDPSSREAAVVAEATARVAKLSDQYNFQVVGVAVGSSRPKAKAFAKEQGIDFPVIDDSSRRIAQRFGLSTPTAMLGVDAEGYLVWGFLSFPTQAPKAVEAVESQMRTALRIPEESASDPLDRPLAPNFTAEVLDSDKPFDLRSTRGQPVVLIFFLHTCPHCHDALTFLKEALAELPEDQRPKLYGLEITGRTAAVRDALRQQHLDFFPVLFDRTGNVANEYGVFSGVPDIILIDREGRITNRMKGWRGETDGSLMRMRLAKLGGAPVPMLLRASGYSGNEVCGVCHESQHETWELTNHSRAFATLVTHGSDSDPECVSCHVVGFGKDGGYSIASRQPDLENVGCESCHGRGGPHLSPDFHKGGDYQSICVGCHDTKHSLGFEYATFLPRVSHAANAHILALPAAERRKIVEARGEIRSDLLPTRAKYVGSDACRSCHAKEFETWSSGPHAQAVATLQAKGKAGNAECLQCHTTGLGRVGGFPPGGDVADHPDLARVGCESCHGPGGDHVAESSRKLGSIVSLGDKCDSCVILQICGTCHDDANDPGFEFEVKQKIDRIRHGTIEAGTGKPLSAKPAATSRAIPSESVLIARAFEAARSSADAWSGR